MGSHSFNLAFFVSPFYFSVSFFFFSRLRRFQTEPLYLDLPFSNSLIIHEEKTKEISTVKEVWICDPNYHKIQRSFALIFSKSYQCSGRVGLVVRALAFHQCGPGSISALGVICGLSLLILYSAMRGFSLGTPVFPSHQKPTFDLT